MTKPKKYHGVVVPMVTPFADNADIDHSAARRIVDYLIDGCVSPFILGTTGEASSVSDSAKMGFIDTVARHADGRTKVYAGISGNCLESSIELGKRCADLGVDAVVAHLPSYYPLTSEHMLKYYEVLADSVPAPLITYNIPSTTHMSIPLDIVEKLSHHPNIVGLKDSEGKTERLEQAVPIWRDRADFSHLTGSSSLSARALMIGSDGIVPSGGNYMPRKYHDLYEAAIKGDNEKAQRLQEETNQISRLYLANRGLSQSLAALKVIMNELDLCEPIVLPPLLPAGTEEVAEIRAKMAAMDIFKEN
jgi:4-hydroxy-tetrahydrodipicolinate synthase